jgi:hypothetical protein
MRDISHTDMQRDLEHWQEEHVLWLRDISHWQTDHQSALGEMERLETICKTHGDAVRKHAEAIAAHEQSLVAHARRLSEDRGTTDRYDELVTSHQQLAVRRAQQRDAHERIRAHHLVVMAHLRTLVQAMDEAM